MTTLSMQATAPPMKITGLMQGRWATQTLKTAVELDIFSTLEAEPLTAQQLATKAGLNFQALELLLNALVSMEYLKREGNKYSLTEVSALYLVKSSPVYFGKHILSEDLMLAVWQDLTATVRDGKARAAVNQDNEAEKFFPELAANIFPINYTTAGMVARELKANESQSGFKILDIAAGSAVWSIPFAEMNKRSSVDALDFTPVLDVTKRFVERHGVADQYKYLAGNWREVAIEQGSYDFVLLGHILHCEGKELSDKLLAHAYSALKPGGVVVVAEFLTNDELTGPLFPMLFALNMLLLTENGCVFSVSELKTMFEQAGFKEARRLSLPFWGPESPVMVARK